MRRKHRITGLIVTVISMTMMLPDNSRAGLPWTKTFLCKENTITISRDADGNYRFQSSGRIEVDPLVGGTMTTERGVRVYKFKSDNTRYWPMGGDARRPAVRSSGSLREQSIET